MLFSLTKCDITLSLKQIDMLQKTCLHTLHMLDHGKIDVTAKSFVGLLILMGIVRLPRLEMYWQVKHPIIASWDIINNEPESIPANLLNITSC